MSDALVTRRLRYVCDNAADLRAALAGLGEPRLLETVAVSRRPGPLLARLETLLDLRHHPAWTDGARQSAGDFAGLPAHEPLVRLVCPHPAACGRSVLWADGEPPRCALTDTDLRWDGDERLSQ